MTRLPGLPPACRGLLFAALVACLPGVASAQPAPPAQLLVERVDRGVITLDWQPASGATPDSYVLEGGLAPNAVLGSLLVDGTSTSAQVALGPGVYFVRAYAVASGVRSRASNEVRVAVGLTAAPSPPEALQATAVGNGVTVSWRPTFTGGVPERMILEVGGPVSSQFQLPVTGPFRVDSVPNGIYTLRLRAANATGTSAATAPVTLRLPGFALSVQQAPTLPPGEAPLPVRYEALDTPRLALLASREGLEGIGAGAASEFARVLAIKEWVAAQFPHSNPDPYPPWDALVILDAIRAGLTGGFCAQYSQVMLQSLAALGFPARYVEVGTVDNPYAHYALEYFSNQFDKWVLLDGDYNVHFERAGRPLSALEVHEALVSNTWQSVRVVQGAYRTGHPSVTAWPRRTIELYYYLRYHLKADHLAQPGEAPFDRWNDMIEWTDALTVPWQSSTVTSPFPKSVLTSRTVASRSVADAPLNRLWVTPRVTNGADVSLTLAHDMPGIQRAEYRVVGATGSAGPWLSHGAPTLVWQVGPSDRAIEVRGVNIRGVAGPATIVSLVAP